MANFEVLVYGITIGDQIAAFNTPVGAASVGIIEDLIQFGMERVLLGTCGV